MVRIACLLLCAVVCAQQSPQQLDAKWALTAESAAKWLDAHPSATAEDLKSALNLQAIALRLDTWLVAMEDPGNVFLLQRREGRFRRVWHTAQSVAAKGEVAEWLAAWKAENASEHPVSARRGGPMFPRIGALPPDNRGRLRFWVEGFYAQFAGATGMSQIILRSWDGRVARPLLGRQYVVMIDQKVGTRLEGDLLKVQQKKQFRSWSSCGSCEERQTDWIVRITPTRVQQVGEKAAVPELDAIDELLWHTIRHQPVRPSLASAEAKQAAAEMAEFPNLGMMMWSVTDLGRGAKLFCIATDNVGSALFRVEKRSTGFHIASIKRTRQSCESPPAP